MLKRWCCGVIGLIMGSTAFTAESGNFSFLETLTNLPGVSGFEKPVRQALQKQWQPFLKEVQVDGMGNMVGFHVNNQQGPRLLLMSHMDEVGFMVESITEDGFLKVVPLGGITDSVVYAQRWQIQTGKGSVIAYSGMDSPHLLNEKNKQSIPGKNALFLDIGADSKQQAEQQFGIRPGLPVTPDSKFTRLSDRRYMAKALDDRIGLAAITDVLQQLRHQQPNQLYVAATVQEEVGSRGASTVYASTKADIAINVEVGLADDYPLLSAERKKRIQLGKGPTLFVYDHTMIPNQELVDWIIALAARHNIPLQLEVETGYGEDGAKLQTSGQGVPTVNLGIPMRYAHQQAGIFDERDYQQLVKLLTLIVENLGPDTYKKIRNS